MASIDTNTSTGGKKKGQPSKLNLKVDFTPMVDMNMLLITFFMFCTTLAAPQIMDVVMPTKDKPENPPQAPESRTITLLLSDNGKVFYYWGFPNYEDPSAFKQTTVNGDGLRSILLEKNQIIAEQVKEIKNLKRQKKLTDQEYTQAMNEIKKSKEGLLVLIKPTEKSNFNTLVKALDEMQICNITQYAIVDVANEDRFLMDNFGNQMVAQANK